MGQFSFSKNKKIVEIEKQFWDSEEIQAEVIKDEKNKVVISLVTKDGKTFLLMQKKYISGGDWKNGKGFSMEFDEAAEQVLTKSLEVCKKYGE